MRVVRKTRRRGENSSKSDWVEAVKGGLVLVEFVEVKKLAAPLQHVPFAQAHLWKVGVVGVVVVFGVANVIVGVVDDVTVADVGVFVVVGVGCCC